MLAEAQAEAVAARAAARRWRERAEKAEETTLAAAGAVTALCGVIAFQQIKRLRSSPRPVTPSTYGGWMLCGGVPLA